MLTSYDMKITGTVLEYMKTGAMNIWGAGRSETDNFGDGKRPVIIPLQLHGLLDGFVTVTLFPARCERVDRVIGEPALAGIMCREMTRICREHEFLRYRLGITAVSFRSNEIVYEIRQLCHPVRIGIVLPIGKIELFAAPAFQVTNCAAPCTGA